MRNPRIFTPPIRITALVFIALMLIAAGPRAGEIHTAAAAGDLNKVRALIEADPTLLDSKGDGGGTPLHRACLAKQVAVANFLIDKGANLNVRDEYQFPPLTRACDVPGQDLALIQRLIDQGADVNAQGYNGLTPLHKAAYSGDLKVAKLLIDNGADPNTYDNYRGPVGVGSISGTVLQVAINFSPNEEMAQLFIESGAKLNRKDSSGNTELHLAAWKGYAALTRALVQHGADVNATNIHNRTALYYAAKHGYRRTADALMAAGASESAIVEANYGKAPQLAATLEEGEADGVKVFDAGFHAGCNEDSLMVKYRQEIDFLKLFGPVDFAILTVHTHSPLPVEIAYESYHYLLDQLSPKAVYLRGANLPEQYAKCAEVLRRRNVPVAYPEGGRSLGERFHFVRESTNAPHPTTRLLKGKTK